MQTKSNTESRFKDNGQDCQCHDNNKSVMERSQVPFNADKVNLLQT